MELRGGPAPMGPLAAGRVAGPPPDLPNIYTDGSVQQAASGGAFFAGAAAVALSPGGGRPTPHADALADYARVEHISATTVATAVMPGLQCSSTRTEAAALLLGLLWQVPAHLATDSAAAISRLDDALRHVPRAGPRPWAFWGTRRDGDLWQAIEGLLAARGCDGVRVSKVKGHATAGDVEAGRATARDRAGNDQADG